MSAIELRHNINEYLTHIDDASFLNAIKTILDLRSQRDHISFLTTRRKELKKEENSSRKVKTISNESLNSEVDQWLSTK